MITAIPTAATPEKRRQIDFVRSLRLDDVRHELIRYGLGTSEACFRDGSAMRDRLAAIRAARISANVPL